MLVVPASIARHESKYPVPVEVLDELVAALSVYCEADRHATTGADGLYTIDSLYFDSDDYILYRLTEEDAAIRSKVRVRSYLSPMGRSSKVKLEVKFKRGPVVTKTSASIPTTDWVAYVQDPVTAPAMPNAEEQDAFDKFVMEVVRYGVRPKLMVRYQRAAFFSRLEEYVRITLDRRVQAQSHTDLSFDVDPQAWIDIDLPREAGEDSRLIMEIKFQQAPPRWLVDIVRRFGLSQYSYSKYGHAVRRHRQRCDLLELRRLAA